MTTEQLGQLRERFEQIRQRLQRVVESPLVRATTLFGMLLGLAGLSTGIGLFRLAGWARTVAMWQAGGSIALALFVTWFSPQRELADAMLGVYEGLLSPDAQQMMQAGQTIGQWLGITLLLVWNGLVFWYFTRPSVKAQFVQQGGLKRTLHHRAS